MSASYSFCDAAAASDLMFAGALRLRSALTMWWRRGRVLGMSGLWVAPCQDSDQYRESWAINICAGFPFGQARANDCLASLVDDGPWDPYIGACASFGVLGVQGVGVGGSTLAWASGDVVCGGSVMGFCLNCVGRWVGRLRYAAI